jgi:hypothetical protein
MLPIYILEQRLSSTEEDGVAVRFIRSPPPKKIKGDDATRWRQVRTQTVVEV